MNLVIDIGNTQIKVAVFQQTILIFKDQFLSDEVISRVLSITEQYTINRAIISHVTNLDRSVILELEKLVNLIELNHQTKLPFSNKYLTPKTLGVDRLALVAGAKGQFPNKNVLIIDAGSCITLDFLNQDGTYFGGDISPGIEMRYKAVNHYTANLPLLHRTDLLPELGDCTQNAIQRGI